MRLDLSSNSRHSAIDLPLACAEQQSKRVQHEHSSEGPAGQLKRDSLRRRRAESKLKNKTNVASMKSLPHFKLQAHRETGNIFSTLFNINNKSSRDRETNLLLGVLLGLFVFLLITNDHVCRANELIGSGGGNNNNDNNKQVAERQANGVESTRAALEAELNAILQEQQHDISQDTNSKLLSEAIISRLMLGNMSDFGPSSSGNFDGSTSAAASLPAPMLSDEQETLAESNEPAAAGLQQQQQQQQQQPSAPTWPEVSRLRKMLNYLQGYQMAQAPSGLNGGQVFADYPVLPSSQAATIKRASMKVGNYLRQQAQQGQPGARQLSSYGRVNSFDFGLGKRPDSSVSGNILRFGDSASAGGHMAPVSGVSGLGKRPSAHRYDFGLGKRVASPAYPRYDFGLGKRAPSRVRYDFGLGK